MLSIRFEFLFAHLMRHFLVLLIYSISLSFLVLLTIISKQFVRETLVSNQALLYRLRTNRWPKSALKLVVNEKTVHVVRVKFFRSLKTGLEDRWTRPGPYCMSILVYIEMAKL